MYNPMIFSLECPNINKGGRSFLGQAVLGVVLASSYNGVLNEFALIVLHRGLSSITKKTVEDSI